MDAMKFVTLKKRDSVRAEELLRDRVLNCEKRSLSSILSSSEDSSCENERNKIKAEEKEKSGERSRRFKIYYK